MILNYTLSRKRALLGQLEYFNGIWKLDGNIVSRLYFWFWCDYYNYVEECSCSEEMNTIIYRGESRSGQSHTLKALPSTFRISTSSRLLDKNTFSFLWLTKATARCPRSVILKPSWQSDLSSNQGNVYQISTSLWVCKDQIKGKIK